MKLAVLDTGGKEVRQIDVDDAVFGVEPNLAVVHQALIAQQANRRRGTASTLSRSQHSAATTKSFRQKGTGRARMGARSSHVRVGGAVAFGPSPRSYKQRLPKKMRRLAIRSMLSQRASEGGLLVLDDPEFEPKTKSVSALLDALGVERSALIVTERSDANLKLGIHNLYRMETCPAATLSVEALLNHDHIIMTESAVRQAEALWGGDRAATSRGKGA
ncbi:MAG: 50S ribosomal protein L4 [Chloroflexi bacterium]|nr:50S ribosomal protein L4 [Chloroflexota bacterium]MCZ6708369.1 50S ribosomal protein L4 [Chloroflexota bacterium]